MLRLLRNEPLSHYQSTFQENSLAMFLTNDTSIQTGEPTRRQSVLYLPATEIGIQALKSKSDPASYAESNICTKLLYRRVRRTGGSSCVVARYIRITGIKTALAGGPARERIHIDAVVQRRSRGRVL